MQNKWEVIESECLVALRAMPDNSVDSIVTDPPSSISFMGKEWDSDRGGRAQWIAWLCEIATEMLRVLKPGGYALVWALPRTSHWTATALEDAGFELRDRISHIFSTGFPKSHSISNDIDKLLGQPARGRAIPTASTQLPVGKYATEKLTSNPVEQYVPRTPEGKKWKGYGTAMKPAIEDWHVCRKPISESTVAANVLEHGTGAINIDACRIALAAGDDATKVLPDQCGDQPGEFYAQGGRHGAVLELKPGGRWPAHLTIQHADECQLVGTQTVKGSRIDKPCPNPEIGGHKWGTLQGNRGPRGIGDENGNEEVEVYACVPWCAVRMLDDSCRTSITGNRRNKNREQQDTGSTPFTRGKNAPEYTDSGGVSRFFYTSKASRSEREAGLRGVVPCAKCGGLDSVEHKFSSGKVEKCIRNDHATVKNIKLMSWLCRLATPSGGTILDPFAGSGSTGVAAMLEGFEFVGIEQDARSVLIARARIQHAFVSTVVESLAAQAGEKKGEST